MTQKHPTTMFLPSLSLGLFVSCGEWIDRGVHRSYGADSLAEQFTPRTQTIFILEHIGAILSITPNLPFNFLSLAWTLAIPFEFLLLTGTL